MDAPSQRTVLAGFSGGLSFSQTAVPIDTASTMQQRPKFVADWGGGGGRASTMGCLSSGVLLGMGPRSVPRSRLASCATGLGTAPADEPRGQGHERKGQGQRAARVARGDAPAPVAARREPRARAVGPTARAAGAAAA